MDVSLLTPLAALVGLLGTIPLAALAAGERRARRAAEILSLAPPRRRRAVGVAVALVSTAALVAAAAAQPVVERGAVERMRPSAEVVVVLDISRSMLARREPAEPTRFDRAQAAALALREELPDVRVGVASFTDRVLPHLFPTTDARAYRSTLRRAIGVDRPPPSVKKVVGTSLGALGALATRNFFDRRTDARVAVVLSDFESEPWAPAQLGELLAKERVRLVLLRVGDASERIFETAEDARYAPDPRAEEAAQRLAAVGQGAVFGESDVGAAAAAVRAEVAGAAPVLVTEERDAVELARWLALAALLPVAFVVRTRNRI
ncbi:MAG TPA: VWA domain-containing protein [Gaiellaceae bacterium]|jgi:hypothetical protein|nr:VWA domain-containing protein [Gaiellaceae bacterium]